MFFRRSRLVAVGLLTVAIVTLLGGAANGDVLADQARVGGNALKVAPVRQDITMDPGTTKTLDIYIENLTTTPGNLHPIINDFTAGTDEQGQPNIILDENQSAPTHSFKQFVVNKPGNFTLGAREQKDIQVKISVPANAAGGGYFGAIRFAAADSSNKQVSLSASVGSLVLLKVNGDIQEKLGVETFQTEQNGQPGHFFTNSKHLAATVRFNNTGNIQVQPFGKVVVKRFGKQVASFDINNTDPRGSVLPDSIRRFDVGLDKIGSFGKYTVEGNFGYGSTGQLLTAKYTFYVLPVTLILLGVAAVLFLLFLIFGFPRMLRAYNRKVIRRAGRR